MTNVRLAAVGIGRGQIRAPLLYATERIERCLPICSSRCQPRRLAHPQLPPILRRHVHADPAEVVGLLFLHVEDRALAGGDHGRAGEDAEGEVGGGSGLDQGFAGHRGGEAGVLGVDLSGLGRVREAVGVERAQGGEVFGAYGLRELAAEVGDFLDELLRFRRIGLARRMGESG